MKPDDECMSSVLVPSRLAPIAYRLACTGPLAFYVIAFLYPAEYNYRPPDPSAQLLWWGLFLCSPTGAILGAAALLQIWRGIPRRTGINRATASVLIGTIGTIAVLYGSASLNSSRKEYRSRFASCQSNIKQISLGTTQYLQDWDERYPLPKTWNEELFPYVKIRESFQCPDEPRQDVPSYGMNRNLASIFYGEIDTPAETVLFFDAVPGKNVVGGIEMLPKPARHSEQDTIEFADGHVKALPEQSIAGLRWIVPTQKKKTGK